MTINERLMWLISGFTLFIQFGNLFFQQCLYYWTIFLVFANINKCLVVEFSGFSLNATTFIEKVHFVTHTKKSKKIFHTLFSWTPEEVSFIICSATNPVLMSICEASFLRKRRRRRKNSTTTKSRKWTQLFDGMPLFAAGALHQLISFPSASLLESQCLCSNPTRPLQYFPDSNKANAYTNCSTNNYK